jgi:catechol 2,3-dioxygenase-like lactoylglutathione lyase family enzyme
MKITPVLYSEKLEPSFGFWVDRQGFEKTAEAPDGDQIGFAILEQGGTELMLQTRASVENDAPALAGTAVPRGGIFIEVDNFEDVLKRIDGVGVVMPERISSYGMREIAVREPGGNVICFAAHVR